MDIAYDMRPWDMVECFAACKMSPYDAMMQSMMSQEWVVVWSVMYKDEVVGMCGINATWGKHPMGHNHNGTIWFLGKDELFANKKEGFVFWRDIIENVKGLGFTTLSNFIPLHRAESHKFLRMLGFDISDKVVHFSHIPFVRFHLTRR